MNDNKKATPICFSFYFPKLQTIRIIVFASGERIIALPVPEAFTSVKWTFCPGQLLLLMSGWVNECIPTSQLPVPPFPPFPPFDGIGIEIEVEELFCASSRVREVRLTLKLLREDWRKPRLMSYQTCEWKWKENKYVLAKTELNPGLASTFHSWFLDLFFIWTKLNRGNFNRFQKSEYALMHRYTYICS